MKVYIICSVRGATDEYRKKLEDYTKTLENSGYSVHLPHRDTNQNATGYEICQQNFNAMLEADEIHIFYNPESQGTHFDMGIVFALNQLKKYTYHDIKIVENINYGEGKSFAKMLDEWMKEKKE